jgi:hypothetical protein
MDDNTDQALSKALEEAGLIDPGDPLAADRFEAYRLLVGRGATIQSLVEYRDDLAPWSLTPP